MSVFIIDYRGYGQSEGKPSEQGTYQDAKAAWKYLIKTCGITDKDIIIFGRSIVIGPMNPYMIIALVELQRYKNDAGFGTLISLMLPYLVVFGIIWIAHAATLGKYRIPACFMVQAGSYLSGYSYVCME